MIFVSGRLTHFGYTDHLIRIMGEFIADLLAYRAFHTGTDQQLNWPRVLGGTLLLGAAMAALFLHLGVTGRFWRVASVVSCTSSITR